MTRKDLSSKWERMHWALKTLTVVLAAGAAVAGVASAWTVKGQDLLALPARVDTLEVHDRARDVSVRALQRSIDAKVDTVRDEVREVKEILLDMNCEQRGLTPAQCREERLRGR